MYAFLITIHILVCICLIISVLLQSGKGADIGAVFGGSGSQALFGSTGPADFLNKATRVMVVVFMLTSLTLGYYAFERPTQSVMDSKTVTQPIAPATDKTASPPAQNTIPVQPAQPSEPAAPAEPVAPAGTE